MKLGSHCENKLGGGYVWLVLRSRPFTNPLRKPSASDVAGPCLRRREHVPTEMLACYD